MVTGGISVENYAELIALRVLLFLKFFYEASTLPFKDLVSNWQQYKR